MSLSLATFPRCTHHTGVVLEVEEDTVCAPPGLALADDDSGHDLLPELRLSLLDGGHDHVTDTGSGQTVKTCANALDGDDVEVTGAGVVAAVHDCAAVRTQLSDIPDLQYPFHIASFICTASQFLLFSFLSIRVLLGAADIVGERTQADRESSSA
jgi:hypothetical protein